MDGKLEAGKYSVTVTDQWDVSEFKGQKSLFFSTTGPFGGKSPWMGVFCLLMGFVVVGIVIALVVLECTKGSSSKHYSLENLKW